MEQYQELFNAIDRLTAKLGMYEKALKDIRTTFYEDLTDLQVCRKMVKIANEALKDNG